MITDAQFTRWLESPRENRVILAELEHAGGVVQVADKPYIAPASERLENPVWNDLLISAVGISLRVDGLIEIGKIELRDDGRITDWLDYQWRGWPVRLFLGDPSWPRAEFRPMAVATNGGLASYRNGVITLDVIDASEQLNEPIDTGQLPNDGGPVPLLLGKRFNVPVHRVDTATLRYRVGYLPLLSVTPRDIGNSVPHTAHLADGAFTLDNHPGNGSEITAEAHEQHDTPMSIVQWVADYYGKQVSPHTVLPNVTVGFYGAGEVTGAQILDALKDTLGAGWHLDALDRLDMRVFDAPGGEATTRLSVDNVEDRTLQLDGVEPPWSGLTLQWGRNDAPLRNVAEVVNQNEPALAARLGQEWRESTGTQDLPGHPLATDETVSTLLQDGGEAQAERDRRLVYHAVRRERWRVTTYLPTVPLYETITVNVSPLVGRVGRVSAVRLERAGGKAELEIIL
ncbi:hypothetical protein ACGLWX_05860 [Halomonas sp. HMF6819]|uniref:hypothetical protein n=1 Tax=Halomonas sp. HMF6819 TaxID=3373085 RepID=UPI0037AE31A7